MLESQEQKEITKAMAAVIHGLTTIPKNGINTFYKSPTHPNGSPYALDSDIINALRPLLTTANLIVYQYVDVDRENKPLATKVVHVASGEWKIVYTPMILQKQDMQGLGSAMTYAKRQGLVGLFFISADVDDDGNGSIVDPKKDSKPAPVKQEAPDYLIKSGTLHKGKKISTLKKEELEAVVSHLIKLEHRDADEQDYLVEAKKRLGLK